jgi:hypothetical protein
VLQCLKIQSSFGKELAKFDESHQHQYISVTVQTGDGVALNEYGFGDGMQRIIRFYQIVDEKQFPFPNAFPFEELQDLVNGLPDDEAYVQLSRMELLGSSWKPGRGVGARRSVPLLAIDRITRDPQLRIERQRNYRPLVLGNNENLADPSFYAVFNDNVLAVMRTSGLAPGPASFRDYVNYLNVCDPPIAVIPLVDGNAARALAEVGTLTRMTVAVSPDVNAEIFSQSPMIFDAIRSARRNLGSVSVEVSVKIAAKGQSRAAEEAHRQISTLVTSDALGFMDKAEIGYRRLEDGMADTHDFIQEAITKSAIVDLDAQTGQPAEPSVAEAMASAYDSRYDDIRSALRPAS